MQQPVVPRPQHTLWPACLHAGLQLPQTEGGAAQEPGARIGLKPLPPWAWPQEEAEEEEDEDGLQ